MNEREALKQLLEALDKELPHNMKHIAAGQRFNARAALAQPEQEPVAWANPNDLQNFDMKVRTSGGPLHTVPLYTTQPQRTWVGLTLKEILDTYRGPDGSDYVEYARGLEAKLKEKNA